MNQYSDYCLLDASLKALASKDDVDRSKVALEIREHVEAAARELSLERFATYENELYQRLFAFVHDENLLVKRGGILAISTLIDSTSSAAESKVIKFANTIAAALKGNTDLATIELVTEALGYMASHSPVSHVDYVESELNRALEWLRSTQPHRLFAACMILKQLADNAPTIFFVRTREFFDMIWTPLWHHQEFLRLSAGQALSACLAVLSQRTYHLQWYCNIYDMIHEGFNQGTAESIHGSLLVVREMLKHTGDFMVPRFKEVCKAIMQLKDHASKAVRSAIATLLPSLASFCPDAFARRHLNESVDLLVKCAATPELRPQALLSTGRLCRALGPHLVTRIDQVILVVHAALVDGYAGNSSGGGGGIGSSSSGHGSSGSGGHSSGSGVGGGGSRRGRNETSPEALQCVSDMVLGLGEPFHGRVVGLLEPMLQGGLTAELINTLTVIATYMPYQRPVVQRRLLEESTRVLGGIPQQVLPPPDYMYSWARRGTRSAIMRRKPYRLSPWGGATSVELEFATSDTIKNIRRISSVTAMVAPPPSAALRPAQRAASVSAMLGSLGPSTALAAEARAPHPTNVYSLIADAAVPALSVTPPLANPDTHAVGTSFFGRKASPALSSSASSEQAKIAVDHILLSLRTLGSLTTPATLLLKLLHESVIPYMGVKDLEVRKEAAITCVKMLVSSGKPFKTRGPTAVVVEEIIACLLELVVTDPAHAVRLAVLNSLSLDFDVYLRKAQHIETLLFLLSDENFDIKMETLTILGRLAHGNPAAVLPPLRQLLIRLISEIKGSSDERCKEEAALMMCNFLRASPLRLIVKPFIGTLVNTLPLNVDIRLTTASLEAMGELCMVVREDILPYADQLMPQIIGSMYDPSSRRKQEMAVKTLGQLVSATGQVVKPYLQYPQLLPRALDLLFASTVSMPWSLRMEVLRTVGLLGALEPHKYSVIVAHLQNLEKSRVAERKGSVSDNGVDFKGLMEMSAVSFISATVGKTVNGFRDRADSNTSVTGSAAAGGEGGLNRTRRGAPRVGSFGEGEKHMGGQQAKWKGDVNQLC